MQTHYLLQGLKNNDLEEKKGFPEIILLKINSPWKMVFSWKGKMWNRRYVYNGQAVLGKTNKRKKTAALEIMVRRLNDIKFATFHYQPFSSLSKFQGFSNLPTYPNPGKFTTTVDSS